MTVDYRGDNTPVRSAEEFRCPACCGELSGGAELVCQKCSRAYRTTDGITDFRVEDHRYYFNPVPVEEMRALVRDMEHDGWVRSVTRFLRFVHNPPGWIDNLTADGRYAWKLLLDLHPDGTLLDIGCGLGNLSNNLAPHVGKVYAMDLTYERAAFSARRFSMTGRDNVVVLAGGDGRYLPFPDGSLDYVVLSGVLEWVGEPGVSGLDEGSKVVRGWRMALSSFGPQSPRLLQLRFLRDIRRVLKPASGQLFVAIENRTGYRYFLGDPDNHSALRFGSLLPRAAANLYSIVSAHRPYRTYTYSIPGYRRLLREAGFPGVRFTGLFPGYSNLREIRPLDTPGDRWRPTMPQGLRARLARSKYLVPAYGIVAGARQDSPRLMDKVLEAVEQALPRSLGAGRLEVHDYSVTQKEKGLLTATYGRFPLVIRLPFGAEAKRGEQANAQFLAFAKKGFGRRLAYIPESRCSGVVHNVEYFVEDRCQGTPLRHAMARAGRTALLSQVQSLLADLNPGPMAAGEEMAGDFYRVRVTQRLEMLSDAFVDAGLRSALEAFFLDRLHGIKVPRGIEHGDFGCDNVLVEGDRVTGLVDWEASSVDGIPLLDALSYVEGAERHFGRQRPLADNIPLLASGQWPNQEESTFLERQYQRFGFDPKHHEALVYFYWLHHVSGQMPYGLAYSESRIARNVLGVARQLLRNA